MDEAEASGPFGALDPDRFTLLRRAVRIWAVGAVRGDSERLAALHDEIGARWVSGDRIVYLGDYVGHGPAVVETIDELLRFRRLVLAQPPFTHLDDVVFLRGSQEEMWSKLLQLQFASEPTRVLDWMFERGVRRTLEAYGGNSSHAYAAARDGSLALSRWTQSILGRMRARAGHSEFHAALKRAAFTENGGLLLVNAGIDPTLPLERQGDRFWWDAGGFASVKAPFAGLGVVVRGSDPARSGLVTGSHTVSLDGGSGLDGELLAVCLSPKGDVVEALVA